MIMQMVETIAGTGLLLVLLAILASAINEVLAAARGSRGKFVKIGLRKLLPDQPIFRRVMQHPLINALYRDRAALGYPPSYLSPRNFTNALLEVVRVRARLAGWAPQGNDRLRDLRRAAQTLQLDHPVIAQSLMPILDRANGDFEKAMTGIEQWYSSAMERVGQWYLNFTRKRLFAIGLVLAVLINVNGINVVRAFWRNAEASAAQQMALGGLASSGAEKAPFEWPIGYVCLGGEGTGAFKRIGGCLASAWDRLGMVDGWVIGFVTLLGWLLTAIAIAMTAPYLFRLLVPQNRY